MLSELAGTGLRRAVTLVMGLSFGGQLIGFIAGGMADSVGPVSLLQLQAVIIASGAFVLYPLSRVSAREELVLARPRTTQDLGWLSAGQRIICDAPSDPLRLFNELHVRRRLRGFGPLDGKGCVFGWG